MLYECEKYALDVRQEILTVTKYILNGSKYLQKRILNEENTYIENYQKVYYINREIFLFKKALDVIKNGHLDIEESYFYDLINELKFLEIDFSIIKTCSRGFKLAFITEMKSTKYMPYQHCILKCEQPCYYLKTNRCNIIDFYASVNKKTYKNIIFPKHPLNTNLNMIAKLLEFLLVNRQYYYVEKIHDNALFSIST